MIRLEGVRFGYARTPILSELDFDVPEGATTVLVGPSGSGKSTVLRLIAGFDAPQRGAVWIGDELASRDGRILRPPEARGVSMVFQDLALWPHMTVRETLDFVLGREVPPRERQGRIEDTLGAVGLARYADARPASLSGGERQRVALARAIVTRPRIMLMDEPLSSLDPPLRQALVAEIRQLQQRLGLTILYVTHNQPETFALGDYAAVMRAGRIEQWGAPRDLYEHPHSAFVATFLGTCALLPGSVREGRLDVALGPANGASYVVIRPEDVVVDEDGPCSGRVTRATCRGSVFQAEIEGPGWRLWTLLRKEPIPGTVLRFSVRKVASIPASATAGQNAPATEFSQGILRRRVSEAGSAHLM